MTALNNSGLIGLLGAEPGGATGYEISRSLRFNSSDSAYLSRTPASAGNRKTWTWAGWVKLAATSFNNFLECVGPTTPGTRTSFMVNDLNKLDFFTDNNSSSRLTTTQVFRDFSAWYHIVLAVDTTQATASNRVKVYVNGSQVTAFDTANYPSQNLDTQVNNTQLHTIGRVYDPFYANMYLADIHFIDGQALDPTSFGEFDDNGIWQPIAYTGTYGTNGFRLPFSDNSTAAALGTDTSGNGNTWSVFNLAASIGTDINPGTPSGTPVQLPWSNAFDGNFSTRAVANQVGGALATYTFASPITFTSLKLVAHSEGSGDPVKVNGTNITGLPTYTSWLANPNQIVDVTSQVTSPLASVSVTWNSSGSAGSGLAAVIVNDSVLLLPSAAAQNDSLVDTPTSYGTDTGAGGEVRGNYATLNPLAGSVGTLSNGNLDCSTSATISHRRSTIAITSGKWYWECTPNSSSDLLVGIVNNNATFSGNNSYPGGDANGWSYYQNNGNKYNNGGSSYGASYTTGDVIGVAFDADAGTLTFYKNGTSQGQAFSGLTSGPYFAAVGNGALADRSYSINFGQRPFAYTAPSGFKALCDTNLPAPVVAKPNTAFDVKLYTGTGSSQTISGLAFSPDLVWIKSRNNTYEHTLSDTVRGANKQLYSSLTNAETSNTDAITAFNSDGFTVGANGGTGFSSATYVGWAWDAGSSTVTNTQGSITSSVRANASAGFSIVTYTGTGATGGTVGHGLGVTPGLIIVKNRDSSSSSWAIYHQSLGKDKYLLLNSTDATTTLADVWGSGALTGSVFGVYAFSSSFNNGNGNSHIAYCFAPVAGYSSMGSYVGNGSADGPFVYTGFRPRWLLTKRTDSTGPWFIYDSARNTYNALDLYLQPHLSSAELTYAGFDFVSNGFKIRNFANSINASGGTYIYAALAESPFQYARAR